MVYGMNWMVEMHAVWEEFDGFNAFERDGRQRREAGGANRPMLPSSWQAHGSALRGPGHHDGWMVALEDVQDHNRMNGRKPCGREE